MKIEKVVDAEKEYTITLTQKEINVLHSAINSLNGRKLKITYSTFYELSNELNKLKTKTHFTTSELGLTFISDETYQ